MPTLIPQTLIPMTELCVMDVWVFQTPEACDARDLYDALPDRLKDGAELSTGLNGGVLRTPSAATASWIRDQAPGVRKAA